MPVNASNISILAPEVDDKIDAFRDWVVAQLEFARFELNGRHQVVENQHTLNVGTAADLVEKTLWQYTLPGGTLDDNGLLLISAVGSMGLNTNNKRVRLYFGSLFFDITSAINANTLWCLNARVFKRGAAAQIAAGAFTFNTESFSDGATLTEDLSADVVVKLTGQNGTAAANDIVLHAAAVEQLTKEQRL